MPDLVSLRARAVSLASRKAAIRRALLDMASVEVRIGPDPHLMFSVPGEDLDEDTEYADSSTWDRLMKGLVPGTSIRLLSSAGLHYVTGRVPRRDDGHSVTVDNAIHQLARIAKLVQDVPDVSAGPDPILESLTSWETRSLVTAYTSAIADMTKDLRDVATCILYVKGDKLPLPKAIKSRCIGLFGRPDHETEFSYEESDFRDYSSHWEEVEGAPPGHRGSRKLVNLHPLLLSARYLAPFVGDEAARKVESSVAAIDRESAPRTGEPAVATHFGSHVDNSIPVDYAEGEIDVDGVADQQPELSGYFR